MQISGVCTPSYFLGLVSPQCCTAFLSTHLSETLPVLINFILTTNKVAGNKLERLAKI
jgi:hypothetical protein